MPRRKPTPKDLPTETAMRKLFPKKAIDKAKKEAENPRSPAKTDSIKEAKHE